MKSKICFNVMSIDDQHRTTIADMANSLAEQVAQRQNIEARQFLEKNNIPYINIQQAQETLQEKGYRLIDENQWNDDHTSQTHRLLLVKIVDQHEYKITIATKIGDGPDA